MNLLFGGLPWLGGAVAAIALFFGVKGSGRKQERTRRDLEDAKAANETNERMNDADISGGNASDDAKWLRERGKRKSGA